MALQNTLKIYINPSTRAALTTDSGTGYLSDSTYTGDGILVFDETAKVIYVKGKPYGLSATDFTTLTSKLNTLIGNVEGDDAKSARVIAGEVSATDIEEALGNSFGTGNDKYATVTAAIQDLQTGISNAQSTADSKIANVTGYKTGTTADDLIDVTVDGTTHVANVKSKQDLIDAVDAANAALPKGASTREDAADLEQAIIGTGAIAAAGATGLANDEVWLYNEEQTLSHLKELINDLGGKDLAEVQAAISAIKAELRDDSVEGNLANTIIDKLANFLNSKTSWTVNGATGVSNVEGIITQLETEISNASAAAAAAHSTVGATGDYITVTSATGASGAQNYTISTTAALDTVAANATSALSTANAAKSATDTLTADAGTTGSLAKAVADLKGTKANGDTTDETIRGAKDYADSAAENAANTVISWITIGATGATGA